MLTHSRPVSAWAFRAFLAAACIGTSVLLTHAGPLNPPAGPIASTNKTLSDIQPRTAVQSLAGDVDSQFRISQPGSYYLTGNITGLSGRRAIEIASDNVVLDLCGFALLGVAGSLDGVGIPAAQTNIVIRNGSIRGFGATGILATNATNSRIENIRCQTNAGTGMFLGEGGSIAACSADANGQSGIAAARNCTITQCTAAQNTGAGFFTSGGSTFEACSATANTLAGFITDNSNPDTDTTTFRACAARLNTQEGFRVGTSAALTACTAANNGFDGFLGSTSGTVNACAASNNGGSGFILGGATVRGCAAFSNDDEGISALCITGCTAYQNGSFGLSGSSLLACAARGNVALQITGVGGSVVSGCVATAGINEGFLIQGGSITYSLAAGNDADGMRVSTEATASGCLSSGNHFDGISVGDRSVIESCMLVNNGSFGIQAVGNLNRIESNHIVVGTGGDGISILSPAVNNLVVANSVSITGAYSINPGNSVANRTGSPVGAADWTNFEW